MKRNLFLIIGLATAFSFPKIALAANCPSTNEVSSKLLEMDLANQLGLALVDKSDFVNAQFLFPALTLHEFQPADKVCQYLQNEVPVLNIKLKPDHN